MLLFPIAFYLTHLVARFLKRTYMYGTTYEIFIMFTLMVL